MPQPNEPSSLTTHWQSGLASTRTGAPCATPRSRSPTTFPKPMCRYPAPPASAPRIRASQAPRSCSPMVLPSYTPLPTLPRSPLPWHRAVWPCRESARAHGSFSHLETPTFSFHAVTREFAIRDRRHLAIWDRCRFDNVERTFQITLTSTHPKYASHPPPPIYTTIVSCFFAFSVQGFELLALALATKVKVRDFRTLHSHSYSSFVCVCLLFGLYL
jgi:hypothetical protein